MVPNIVNDGLYGLLNCHTNRLLKCYTNETEGITKFHVTDPEESRGIRAYAFIVHVVQINPLTITLKTADGKENISCKTLGAVPKRDGKKDVQWVVKDGFKDGFYLLESADGRHVWMGVDTGGHLQGNIFQGVRRNLGAHLYWRFVRLHQDSNKMEERYDMFRKLRRAQGQI